MALLELKNLNLSIHGKQVLQNVSMSVEPGRVLGVIGESGSGKSMTANAAMQLLPRGTQVSGSITLDGTELLTLSEAEMTKVRGKDIGMVFQEPMTALNPVQTIGAQVAETLRVHGQTSRREAMRIARDALARVGLPPDRFPMSRFPHEMSGGQRQRVVIAIAIASRPKLLIADEPTTALDVTTQAQILKLLGKLIREDNMGLVLISHDLAVVSDMADSLAIMRQGRVVEQGDAGHLYANMSHPYTQSLFKASDHQPDRKQFSDSHDRPLFQVSNLVRDYATPRTHLFRPPGRFRAIDHVSFEIRRGESLGLVGESGCGKSTLTRALLGLEPVQSGDIVFDGEPVVRDGRVMPEIRRKMQVVFQDPYASFNPRHTVSRLVTEPYHLLGNPPRGAARHAAVAEALEAVGVPRDAGTRYIHEFSGGERQRIAIARALIIRPELIILDEAVSALDVSIRAQILDLLADLSRDYGLTYLFISHDLSVVRAITDRTLVMKDGEIVEQGPTERLFTAPEHPYTRALLAAAPKLPKTSYEKARI